MECHCRLLWCSLQALRGKEQFFLELKYRKMATPNPGQANNLALINFEDFRRFQMLISYHLEEVERALTMFGKTASSGQGAGTSARFGVYRLPLRAGLVALDALMLRLSMGSWHCSAGLTHKNAAGRTQRVRARGESCAAKQGVAFAGAT
jgi:hypothetical protein